MRFFFKTSSPLAELLHPPSKWQFIATTFTICFFKHLRDFCRFFPSHHKNPNDRMHFERGVHVHMQLHCTRLPNLRLFLHSFATKFGACGPVRPFFFDDSNYTEQYMNMTETFLVPSLCTKCKLH